jgi:hypothetical protein
MQGKINKGITTTWGNQATVKPSQEHYRSWLGFFYSKWRRSHEESICLGTGDDADGVWFWGCHGYLQTAGIRLSYYRSNRLDH